MEYIALDNIAKNDYIYIHHDGKVLNGNGYPFALRGGVAKHDILIGRCLNSFSGATLVQFLDHYLPQLEVKTITKMQREWLSNNASPKGGDDVWDRLRPSSKKFLAKLLRLNLFTHFRNVMNELVKNYSDVFDDGVSAVACAKRARSRLTFWSNYSEKMISSRLIPLWI